MSETPEAITLNVQWVQDPTAVPLPANQFAVVGGPNIEGETVTDAYILTLGHLTPPILPPGLSPEQVSDAFQAQPILIAPVGRFELTTARLRQLRDTLTQVLGDGPQ